MSEWIKWENERKSWHLGEKKEAVKVGGKWKKKSLVGCKRTELGDLWETIAKATSRVQE